MVRLIQDKQGDPLLLASLLAQAQCILAELDGQIPALTAPNKPPLDGAQPSG